MTSRVRQSARLATAVVVLSALVLASPRSLSALTIERCVSQDNHLYVILSSTSDFTQVTSVSMTNANANACCELGSAGDVLTALAAGSGVPLPNRARTTVIAGLPSNSVTCAGNFSASAAGGQGQLTLPGGVKKVSANAGFTTETVVPVTTADVAVPAAFDVGSVSRSITGCSVSGVAMAFPSTAGVNNPSDQTAGEQSSQTVTYDDTDGSTIGNRAPGNNVPPTQATPDGFRLQGDCSSPATCQVIVFIATQDGAIGSGVAASGFTLDSSEITQNTECAAQPVTFNTPTRTSTPTRTATATSTDTATATATETATATATPPATATTTGSTTATKTGTTTGTVTSTPTITPTPTATRTGICSLTPVAGCATPVGFHRPFRINHKKQLVTWRFRSTGSIPLADFDDPVNTTSYSLCVYTGAIPTFLFELHAPADGSCAGKPCWKARGTKGFRYRDHTRSNSGISRLVLRTQPDVLADLVLRARGPNVPLPTQPLTEPVLVQLVKSTGPECWQGNYSSPALKNNANTYKDKND